MIQKQWYPEVLHFCPTTPLILVGLKSDLRTKRTCIDLLKTQGLTPVTPDQGKAVADRMGAIYVECSSKEMRGVDRVFELAVNTAVEVEDSSYEEGGDKGMGGGGGAGLVGGGGGVYGGGGGAMTGKKVKKRSCNFF